MFEHNSFADCIISILNTFTNVGNNLLLLNLGRDSFDVRGRWPQYWSLTIVYTNLNCEGSLNNVPGHISGHDPIIMLDGVGPSLSEITLLSIVGSSEYFLFSGIDWFCLITGTFWFEVVESVWLSSSLKRTKRFALACSSLQTMGLMRDRNTINWNFIMIINAVTKVLFDPHTFQKYILQQWFDVISTTFFQ